MYAHGVDFDGASCETFWSAATSGKPRREEEEVREAVRIVRPKPIDWEAYAKEAIDIDNDMWEDRKNKKRQRRQNRAANNSHGPPTAPSATGATLPPGEPMEVDALNLKTSKPKGPLTAEEKARRRREGLCSYCGVKGHFADSCPNKSEAAKKRDAERKSKA